MAILLTLIESDHEARGGDSYPLTHYGKEWVKRDGEQELAVPMKRG